MPAFLWSFAASACVFCAYYALRPLRETFGVRGGAGNLQWLFSGTFLLSLIAWPAYCALVTRFARRTLVQVFFHGTVLCLVGFWIAFATLEGEAAKNAGRVFFVWLSVYVMVSMSLFWSFMVDVHSSSAGKRLFGPIAGGGTLGGLCGSALAGWLAGPLGPNVLAVPILLLEAAILCLLRLETPETGIARAGRIGGGILDGLRSIARSPYLIGICAYLFLATWSGTVLYLERAAIVEAKIADDAARTQLFAWMDFAVQATTAVVQLLVTPRLIRRFGMTFALATLPVFSAACLALLGLTEELHVLVVLMVLHTSLRHSVSKPSTEVLFTVVDREQKYTSKSFNDVIVYRGGDALSSWLFKGMRTAGMSLPAIALAAAPVCAAWAFLSLPLGRKQGELARASDPRAAAAP